MKRRTSRRRKQRFPFLLLRLVCLLTILLCAVGLIAKAAVRQRNEQAQAEMHTLFYGTQEGSGATIAPLSEAAPELPEETPMAGPWDQTLEPRAAFESLLLVNPDTKGWLTAGDVIDTAVTQRDNEFYLSHNFFGEEASEGMAFMDAGCCVLPEDTHFIIHGHNMRNGTVFGNLDNFRSADYLKAHPVIRYNTLYRDAAYVPIAIFDISAEPDDPSYMDIQQFNFDSDQDFAAFVADAKSRSAIDLPFDAQPGDRLLSLLTCSYTNRNGRLVVMCRELREGETEETISAEMAKIG